MSLLPYANGERKRADLKDNRGSKEPRGSVLDLRPLGTTYVTTACLPPRPHRLKVAAALSMGMGVGTVALAWVLLPTFGVIAVGWAFLLMQSAGCLFVLFDLAQSRATQRGLVS